VRYTHPRFLTGSLSAPNRCPEVMAIARIMGALAAIFLAIALVGWVTLSF